MKTPPTNAEIEKEFDEKFKNGVPPMKIHNAGTPESWIEHPEIKSFLLSKLDEQMSWVSDGKKNHPVCDNDSCSAYQAYNQALSDVLNLIRGSNKDTV